MNRVFASATLAIILAIGLGATPASAWYNDEYPSGGTSLTATNVTQTTAILHFVARTDRYQIYACPSGVKPPCEVIDQVSTPGATLENGVQVDRMIISLKENTAYTVYVAGMHMTVSVPGLPIFNQKEQVVASTTLTTLGFNLDSTRLTAAHTSVTFEFFDGAVGPDRIIYAARSWEHKKPYSEGEHWYAATVPAAMTSYTLTGLTPNTKYWFIVSRGNTLSRELPTQTTTPTLPKVAPTYSGQTLQVQVPSLSGVSGKLQVWVKPYGASESIYIGQLKNKLDGSSAGKVAASVPLVEGGKAAVFSTIEVNGIVLKSRDVTIVRPKTGVFTITGVTFVVTKPWKVKAWILSPDIQFETIGSFLRYFAKDKFGQSQDCTEYMPGHYGYPKDGIWEDRQYGACFVESEKEKGNYGYIKVSWTNPKDLKKGTAIKVDLCPTNIVFAPATSCNGLESATSPDRVIKSTDIIVSRSSLRDSAPWTLECVGWTCTSYPSVVVKTTKNKKVQALSALGKVVAADVTLTGAKITWPAGTDAQVAIAYNKSGPWLYKGSTKAGKWMLSNLKPATTYWVKAYSTKGKSTSSKASYESFKTKSSTPTWPELQKTVTQQTVDGFTLSWRTPYTSIKGKKTAIYIANKLEGRYRYVGTVSGKTSYRFTGLDSSKSYFVRVQDVSGGGTQARLSMASSSRPAKAVAPTWKFTAKNGGGLAYNVQVSFTRPSTCKGDVLLYYGEKSDGPYVFLANLGAKKGTQKHTVGMPRARTFSFAVVCGTTALDGSAPVVTAHKSAPAITNVAIS